MTELLSDADLGIQTPAAPEPDVAPDASARPLTVTPRPAPVAAGPALLSDADLGIGGVPTGPAKPLDNAANDSAYTSALKGLGTTAIKGAGHIVGVAGDVMDLSDYLIARAQAAITGKPIEDIQAQQAKDRKADWTDPRNYLPSGAEVSAPDLAQLGEYKPQSVPAKLAMAGGEAALGGAAFGGGLAAAALNATGGAAGQAASDITGDPLAGLAAGIIAPGLASGVGTVAGKVAAPALMGVPGIDRVPILGPRVTAARDNAAATQLLGKSSDPAGLRDALAQPAAPANVPNSPQTLAGSIGNDRGLFQAEKDARNVDNSTFNAIDRAQSDAQQAALAAPNAGADVFRPGRMMTDRLNAIDAARQQAEDRLQSAYQDAVTQRGQAGQAFADQQRGDLVDRTIARGQDAADGKAQQDAAAQAAHDRLVDFFSVGQQRAEGAAEAASAPLRTLPSAEATGDTLRTAMDAAKGAANEERRRLYGLVPDTATVVSTPVKDAVTTALRGIDPHVGVQPAGAEAALYGKIAQLPDVIPFRSLQTLDSQVTAAMSDARRNPNPADPQVASRLSSLKGAVLDAIENATDNHAAHEARMVEAGVMPAEETMQSRFGEALQAEANAFRAERSNAVGGGSGPGASNPASSRSSRVSGPGGTESATNGRSGNVAGNPRLAPEAGATAFDQAGAQALSDAKAAHVAYKTTFDNPTVRPVLADNGFRGQHTMPAGAIPSKAVVAGGKGYETARAFLDATGRTPEAVAALGDAALAPLRKAMPPVGTLHPNALARWKGEDGFGGALRALDEASPGFSQRFDNAANATQALLDIGVQRKQALQDQARSAARDAILANAARREAQGQANAADRTQVAKLIAERNGDDASRNAQDKGAMQAGIAQARGMQRDARATPAGQFAGRVGGSDSVDEVQNAVGAALKTGTSGSTRMRSLVAAAESDPEALAGLRRAGTDWMVREFKTKDGTVSGARLIDFVRDNKDTLKELYPTAQVSMMGAIARDLEQNTRWFTETAVPGSDTAKNLPGVVSKVIEQGKGHVSIGSAAIAGYLAGGPKGAAGAASLYLLSTLRSAGINSVEALYREALADPEKARYIISKMPASVEGGKLRALSGLLRRELIVGTDAVNDKKKASTRH